MERKGENRLGRTAYKLVLSFAVFSQVFFPDLLRSANQPANPWTARLETARTAFQEARYLEALALYRTVGEEAAAGSPEIRGQVLTSIGACLLVLSDYRGALREFLKARPLTVQGGNPEHLAALDANIASVYVLQGDFENGGRIYRRALEALPGDAPSLKRPQILANLGLIELLEARWVRAARYEQRALEELGASADRRLRAEVLDLAGLAQLGLRQYLRARRCFEASLALRRGAGTTADLSRSLTYLGRTELEKGNAAEALEWLNQAEVQSRHRGDRATRWPVLYLRGRSHAKKGQTGQALSDLRASVELLETDRARLVPTDAMRILFEVSRHEVYAALADLLCQTGPPDEAFHAVELGRAHSLRALVRSRPATEGGTLWLPYADRLARLEALRARSLAAAGPEESAVWLRRLTDQEADLRDLESRLRLEDPVAFAPAATLQDAQRMLGSDSLLLNYYTGGEAACLWAVTDREARFYRLAPAAGWAGEAARFRRELAPASGRILYRTLLGSVDPVLLRRRHWIIAGDGELEFLPFAALPGAHSQYLIEERSISHVPSASVLQSLLARPRREYQRDLLALADPVVNAADPRLGSQAAPLQPAERLPRLVASAAEVRECARLFPPDRWSLLTGLRASEAELRQLARYSYRYWHISSHVRLDPDRPSHSFIALSLPPGGSAPEKLTVLDILGLPVRAEMVLVNGCDSGAGKILPGTGVLGLARAFLAAGAQSVCATRWRIPDDGGSLVRELYAVLLREAVDRAEALRQAQVRMIRAGDWRSHPRYWAAYFLTGSPWTNR